VGGGPGKWAVEELRVPPPDTLAVRHTGRASDEAPVTSCIQSRLGVLQVPQFQQLQRVAVGENASEMIGDGRPIRR
jgi:hypothetical protein